MFILTKRYLLSILHERILVVFDRIMLFPESCRVLATSESVAILDRIFLKEGTQASYHSDRLLRRSPLPCILTIQTHSSIFTDCDLSSTEATHTFYAILFLGGREAKRSQGIRHVCILRRRKEFRKI